MIFFNTKDAKNAFYIGAVCVLGYVVCYFARNLLGVVSPYMMEEGLYDIQFIGLLSTSNMLFYAVGQLVNGIIGDRIKSKYMIGCGLTFSGICYLIMAFSDVRILIAALYSLSGFFLSMLYAPMMKLIAENTRPIHAIRCSLGLSFASLTGTPIVGILAIIFQWNMVFVVCGFTLIITGILSFICIYRFEIAGIVEYKQIQKSTGQGGSLKVLIQHEIIKFSFVSILTGIVRTSVVFWIPTYLSQFLELPSASATTVFTVMSIAQAATPYISMVLIYDRLLKRNMNGMLIVMFASSAISFLMMYIVSSGAVNILCLFLAVLTANGAACALWNAYCPGLKETGMVSTATGYLDFLSYAAAALANHLFANAVSDIGWGNLILVWGALMLAGVLVAAPIRKK